MLARLRRFIIFALVAYGLLAAGAWIWISQAASSHVVDDPARVDAAGTALVLGTSPTNRAGDAPNSYFVHRIAAAAALYRDGKARRLIVSGDRRDEAYDEPRAMRDALIAAGVPAERIDLDNAGFHTRDSLARAHLIFGQTEAIVVSQRFHAERAVFIARAHGLRFTGFAAQDVDASFGFLTMARETFSRLVALIDALSPEQAPADDKISPGATQAR